MQWLRAEWSDVPNSVSDPAMCGAIMLKSLNMHLHIPAVGITPSRQIVLRWIKSNNVSGQQT